MADERQGAEAVLARWVDEHHMDVPELRRGHYLGGATSWLASVEWRGDEREGEGDTIEEALEELVSAMVAQCSECNAEVPDEGPCGWPARCERCRLAAVDRALMKTRGRHV